MNRRSNDDNKKRSVLWILPVVLMIICAVVFYQITVRKTKQNEIELDKLSYAIISYGDVYQELNTSQAKELAVKLQDALNLENVDLEHTNGEVELKNHRYVGESKDDFTIELILKEPQKLWVVSDIEEKEKTAKTIYGIFYSPNHDETVLDFSLGRENVENGEYTMELAGFEVDEEALEELRNEIKQIVEN